MIKTMRNVSSELDMRMERQEPGVDSVFRESLFSVQCSTQLRFSTEGYDWRPETYQSTDCQPICLFWSSFSITIVNTSVMDELLSF